MRRNCAGGSRRDCLQLGLSALLGGGLATSLRAKANAVGAAPRAKSCILIWMDGGPSHFETFDPKPDAPTQYRGEFAVAKTSTPGVAFAEYLPKLAGMFDKLAVVRSIRHDQGNHGAGNHYLMTGAPPRIPVGCGAFVSFHPSLGSVVAKHKPAPAGLPSYFSLPGMTRSGGPNFLGAKYAPFVVDGDPNGQGFRVRDVALPPGLTDGRFADRASLRTELDHFQRIVDETAGDPAVALDDNYRQAADLMRSAEAQAAFDIHQEPAAVRDRYGRTPLGQRALLARRLVAAGVPFVTLNDGGWDHHEDIFKSLKERLPKWDRAVSALVSDLDDRGLLDTTLVIAVGEFGRTPLINKRGGRDHWANAMSALFAGGGCPGGTVVGATDKNGFAAADPTLSPENFAATVYTKLGIDPDAMLHTPDGRPIHLVSNPRPIRELMG